MHESEPFLYAALRLQGYGGFQVPGFRLSGCRGFLRGHGQRFIFVLISALPRCSLKSNLGPEATGALFGREE